VRLLEGWFFGVASIAPHGVVEQKAENYPQGSKKLGGVVQVKPYKGADHEAKQRSGCGERDFF
jgi:hypothetical protein